LRVSEAPETFESFRNHEKIYLKVSDMKVSDKKVSDMKVKVSGRKLKFPFFCKFFGKKEFLPKVSETLTVEATVIQ
jgi:hypothetical protein